MQTLKVYAFFMGAQIPLRLINLITNLVLASRLPEISYQFGMVNYRCFLAVILYISREGFFRTLVRADAAYKDDDTAALARCVVSMLQMLPWSALVAALGTVLAVLFTNSKDHPHVHTGYALHAIAALLELIGEPLHILAMQRARINTVAAVQTAATVASAITGCSLALGQTMSGSMVFSTARLVYGGAVLVGYTVWAALVMELRTPETGGSSEGGLQQVLEEVRKKRAAAQQPGGGDGSRALMPAFTLQAVGNVLVYEGTRLAVLVVGSASDKNVLALSSIVDPLMERCSQPLEYAGLDALFKSREGAASDKYFLRDLMLWLGPSLLSALVVPNTAHLLAQFSKLMLLSQYHGPHWRDTGAPGELLLYTQHWQIMLCYGLLILVAQAAQRDVATMQHGSWALLASAVLQVAVVGLLGHHHGLLGILAASCSAMLLRLLFCLFWQLRGVLPIRCNSPNLWAVSAAIAAFVGYMQYQMYLGIHAYYRRGLETPINGRLNLTPGDAREWGGFVLFYLGTAFVLEWFLLRLWIQWLAEDQVKYEEEARVVLVHRIGLEL